MPSKSPKQKKFMNIAAHDKSFAKKAGIQQSVAKEFVKADKENKMEEEEMTGCKTFGPATDFAEDCMLWRGRILTGDDAHFCWDWDGLPVDETCPEYETCQCADMIHKNRS